jgi:hypothetical protein
MATRDRRQSGDRRARMRGGRRAGDRASCGPLIFVVTREPLALRFWEALFIERRFAVVPFGEPAQALEMYAALRPDAIVASKRDLPMLRQRLSFGGRDPVTPLVELVSTPDLVEPVMQAIRRALRAPHRMAS